MSADDDGGTPETFDGDRETTVEVDLKANTATVEIVETRRRSVRNLFRDGELRLWEDSVGWTGFERTESGFRRVHTLHDGRWSEREPCSLEDVAESVREHIKDPKAGDAGRFVRGCSPP